MDLGLAQEVTALFVPANLHLSWGNWSPSKGEVTAEHFNVWQKAPCPVGALVHPTACSGLQLFIERGRC